MSGRPTPSTDGRLRVAVDATPLIGTRTGVAALTGGALEGLGRRTDLDVRAYALTWRGRRELADVLPAGVRAVSRPMAARPLRRAWERFERPPIEWWTGPIDVVHGTNFVGPPTRRAASVVTVHDLTPLRFPELCTPDTLAYPRLLSRALARGAWVHVTNRFVADEVVDRLDAAPGRVVVAAPGVPEGPAGDAGAGRRLAGCEPGDRYVCTLGTIEPRKDHAALVRAFDVVATEAPDLRLVVAGPDGWGAEAFHAALDAARHRTRITRLGFLDAQQRAHLLAGASVFAYPSVYEGFGFPPLEAMTAGVPVVATAVGALPEVLGDAAALVPAGDDGALARALARLASDEREADRLRSAGRARVARYSWSSFADGLADIYRQAACGR